MNATKKHTPAQLLGPYKAKVYAGEGPCIVFNPSPRCFLPMIGMNLGGIPHYTMHPDVPVFPTLEAAQDYHRQQIEAARKEKAPQLYVPPGRGKLQA